MGFSFSTIFAIATTAIAAIFVILEQWKCEKPWRSWKLWLACVFLALSIVTIVVESNTASGLERQRRADLLLIQKQNTALHSLCFELHLQPYDTTWYLGCHMQITTNSQVAATLVRSGLIAEYIQFMFHPDSGWYRSSNSRHSWPSVILEHDSVENTVRFHMTPFGIRWQRKGGLLWKAERLADLAQVRFGFQLMYGADPKIPAMYGALRPPDLSWNPIESIYIYANSYEVDNLITRLVPMERSYGVGHTVIYFHPEAQQVREPDWFQFYIDLLQMRAHILDYLDSKN